MTLNVLRGVFNRLLGVNRRWRSISNHLSDILSTTHWLNNLSPLIERLPLKLSHTVNTLSDSPTLKLSQNNYSPSSELICRVISRWLLSQAYHFRHEVMERKLGIRVILLGIRVILLFYKGSLRAGRNEDLNSVCESLSCLTSPPNSSIAMYSTTPLCY